MSRQFKTDVNAGSTADIAFLLLIFFLVTTTIQTDKGINRKLPPKKPDITSRNITDNNLFVVLINAQGELLVENEPMELGELRAGAIAFLDNGGGQGEEQCTYCQGLKDQTLSVNPQKAVISVQTDRQTKYKDYIAVQNELVAAFNYLRNREAMNLFGMSYEKMESLYSDENYKENKTLLKQNIETVRQLYPLNLSEAEPISRQSFQ